LLAQLKKKEHKTEITKRRKRERVPQEKLKASYRTERGKKYTLDGQY